MSGLDFRAKYRAGRRCSAGSDATSGRQGRRAVYVLQERRWQWDGRRRNCSEVACQKGAGQYEAARGVCGQCSRCRRSAEGERGSAVTEVASWPQVRRPDVPAAPQASSVAAVGAPNPGEAGVAQKSPLWAVCRAVSVRFRQRGLPTSRWQCFGCKVPGTFTFAAPAAVAGGGTDTRLG